MSVAALYNVPTTREQLDMWAFAHMAHHRDIVRVIYELSSIALPEYVLDPVLPQGGPTSYDWERLHQTMHAQMDALLGIEGYNLLGVNWNDENQLAAWIQLNADEHFQAGNLLRLG